MSLFSREQHASIEFKGIKLAHRLIEFMKYRFWGYGLSCIIILVSLFFVFTKGFNWGLDFTGGTVIDTHFSRVVDLNEVRATLKEYQIEGAIVQASGGTRDVIIRVPATAGTSEIGAKLKTILATKIDSQVIFRSIDFVGPNVGEELTRAAVYATLATLAMLLVYVGLRFEWRLAVGAVLSLAHDVMVTLGFFALMQVEIDLTFVAAILSVVGYSLNDSIVVFDRVRENLRKIRRASVFDVIDISLTQTLSRTLMTSVTTLIVVVALLVFGGSSIYSFSLALLVGIGFGAYSSIFIAIALAYDFGLKREHMLPPQVEKEGEDRSL